jgi:putative ABC transport system ATP-binding protein
MHTNPHTNRLEAHRLTHVYGEGASASPALADVSLTIGADGPEAVAIMGPSGSGKSTLLHVLAGIVAPADGRVVWRGQDLATMRDGARTRLRRSDFGFVFQSGQLLPELPAIENVALPLMLGGGSRVGAEAAAGALLDRLGLGAMLHRRPGELSGGQAQRVAIARALVGQPGIVFADEPTGALDRATGQAVMALLIGATLGHGASLVVVTHDPEVAAACSRVVRLEDGRIVSDGAPGAAVPPVEERAPQAHAFPPPVEERAPQAHASFPPVEERAPQAHASRDHAHLAAGSTHPSRWSAQAPAHPAPYGAAHPAPHGASAPVVPAPAVAAPAPAPTYGQQRVANPMQQWIEQSAQHPGVTR